MYRYVENDQPAWKCPVCGKVWTKHGGVTLTSSVAGQQVDVLSRLDDAGKLHDTEDGAIENGSREARLTSCPISTKLPLEASQQDRLPTSLPEFVRPV